MRTLTLCTLLLAACAGSNQEQKAKEKPLYDRLGGKPAITAVVDNGVARIAKDQRINARFANTDIPHLKLMLVEQICEASGGPCKYSGKSMKESHKGQNLGDDEFNALVEDLKAALDELKVPAKEQNELLGALGSMKPDIVRQ
jgi:hemoglobin